MMMMMKMMKMKMKMKMKMMMMMMMMMMIHMVVEQQGQCQVMPMAHAGSCWWDPAGDYVWSPILLVAHLRPPWKSSIAMVAQLSHLHGTLHASCEMHNMSVA